MANFVLVGDVPAKDVGERKIRSRRESSRIEACLAPKTLVAEPKAHEVVQEHPVQECAVEEHAVQEHPVQEHPVQEHAVQECAVQECAVVVLTLAQSPEVATGKVPKDSPTKSGPVISAAPARRTRELTAAVSALSFPSRHALPEIEHDDRRWARRKRAEMPAYIGHPKNPQGVRCIVRDTSSSGALVEVVSGSDRFSNPAEEIPDKFTLAFMSYKERTEVSCAVMRRAGRLLGVRYVSAFRTFPAPSSGAKNAGPGTKNAGPGTKNAGAVSAGARRR